MQINDRGRLILRENSHDQRDHFIHLDHAYCIYITFLYIEFYYITVGTPAVDLEPPQWARKLKKVQAKKIVKSNKSKKYFS